MLASVGSLWEWVAPNYALISIVLTAIAAILVPVLILAKYVRLILPILKDTHPPLSRGPHDRSKTHLPSLHAYTAVHDGSWQTSAP